MNTAGQTSGVGETAEARFSDPNRHAPKPRLIIGEEAVLVRGYQNYTITRRSCRPMWEERNLAQKSAVVTPVLTSELVGGRSVLDLGSNAAYFSFVAAQNGAAEVTAVDLDETYIGMIRRTAGALGITNVLPQQARVDEWKQPADVVLALALVHWLYACTAEFGSMDAIIGWLAGLTRYALVVEWIAPTDSSILQFGHIDNYADGAGARPTRAGYRYDFFRAALARHFVRVEPAGHVSETRQVFVAYKPAPAVEIAGPLPLLHDRATVISSRLQTSFQNVSYWSRVYDLGDRLCKQTSGMLAAREAVLLARVAGRGVPKVIDFSTGQDAATGKPATSSHLVMEKISGVTIAGAATVLADPAIAHRIAADGLELLQRLGAAGVTHRDINPDNLLIDGDGRLVLIDFGWAVALDMPLDPPPLLGLPMRAPEGPVSDSYALGRTLQSVISAGVEWLHAVLALMTQASPMLRLTDLATIGALLAAARRQDLAGERMNHGS